MKAVWYAARYTVTFGASMYHGEVWDTITVECRILSQPVRLPSWCSAVTSVGYKGTLSSLH